MVAGDGGGTLLLGEAVVAIQVPGVHTGVVSGITYGTTPGPAWYNLGTSLGVHPVHPVDPIHLCPQSLQGPISMGIQVGGIPSGRLQGEVIDTHQPPYLLRAPPCVVHESDFRGS